MANNDDNNNRDRSWNNDVSSGDEVHLTIIKQEYDMYIYECVELSHMKPIANTHTTQLSLHGDVVYT